MTDILLREDTGTHAVVRVIDPGVHVSAPYSRAEGLAAMHDIDQWASATIDRAILGVKRRFYDDIDRIIADCLDGARLPKQWPTVDDLIARRQRQEQTAEWPVQVGSVKWAELPDEPIKKQAPSFEVPPNTATNVVDPVTAYMAADDPDERPGLPARYDPVLAEQARDGLLLQARRQGWTPAPRPARQTTSFMPVQHRAPNTNPRLVRQVNKGLKRLGEPEDHGRIDRWLRRADERLRAWWRAKQADTDQQMATRPHATGLPSENPYCMRCGKHLGRPFHETNEHDEAANLGPALAGRAQGAPTEAAHAGRSPESAYHRGSESGRTRGRLRAWWRAKQAQRDKRMGVEE